jgi:hypothetical protein
MIGNVKYPCATPYMHPCSKTQTLDTQTCITIVCIYKTCTHFPLPLRTLICQCSTKSKKKCKNQKGHTKMEKNEEETNLTAWDGEKERCIRKWHQTNLYLFIYIYKIYNCKLRIIPYRLTYEIIIYLW